MSERRHEYAARLEWTGHHGAGTTSYETYGRDYTIAIDGKPPLAGSADPAFRGDPARHNPEDLLLAAASSCHLLSYLALCARARIVVLRYADEASGTMEEDGRGGGRFTDIVLRPRVVVADAAQRDRALALHAKAHELCFIANSLALPVRHEATVEVAP